TCPGEFRHRLDGRRSDVEIEHRPDLRFGQIRRERRLRGALLEPVDSWPAAHRPHRAITRAVMSSLDGGFSRRPSEWSSSWMIIAAPIRGSFLWASRNRREQMKMARLPGWVNAGIRGMVQ